MKNLAAAALLFATPLALGSTAAAQSTPLLNVSQIVSIEVQSAALLKMPTDQRYAALYKEALEACSTPGLKHSDQRRLDTACAIKLTSDAWDMLEIERAVSADTSVD